METFENYIKTTDLFIYARPYEYPKDYSATPIQIEVPEYILNSRSRGGGGSKRLITLIVHVMGIPDGVSPIVNYAQVPVNCRRKLYYFSTTPLLTNEIIRFIDERVNVNELKRYQPLRLLLPCARTEYDEVSNRYKFPYSNFYTRSEDPENIIQCSDDEYNENVANDSKLRSVKSIILPAYNFVDYRYFLKRHSPPNIFFDESTGYIYRLSLTRHIRSLCVLIMPQNFIRLGNRTGFFYSDIKKIIVRMFSKYFLVGGITYDKAIESSKVDESILDKVTVLNVEKDIYAVNTISGFFSRIGCISTYSPSERQLVGFDGNESVYIVGPITNISL